MIAWSDFFKSYIKLCKYKDDNNWSFWLCNEDGKSKSKLPMKARSKFSAFDWKETEVSL